MKRHFNGVGSQAVFRVKFQLPQRTYGILPIEEIGSREDDV
ncbi:MAG TPA: hypothetical protein VFZ59_27570 [Verrucomicrobiae bacterium]|nr:hypothetical protein [Verrucomicrobiae bacterium]